MEAQIVIDPVDQTGREAVRREGASEETGQRDADLNRGEKAGGFLDQLQKLRSGLVALLGHSLELGGVQGNHGDFRHGKKCVQKNEHGLHEQLPEYVHE